VAVAREFSLRGIALGTLSTHFSSYPSELRRRAVRLVVQGLDVFVRDGTIQTLIVADVVRLANARSYPRAVTMHRSSVKSRISALPSAPDRISMWIILERRCPDSSVQACRKHPQNSASKPNHHQQYEK
jgi:hypothetical protein